MLESKLSLDGLIFIMETSVIVHRHACDVSNSVLTAERLGGAAGGLRSTAGGLEARLGGLETRLGGLEPTAERVGVREWVKQSVGACD